MKTYKVEITETLQRIVEVQAENEEEAIKKVNDLYDDCEIVLPDEQTYIDHEIKIYNEV